MIDLVDFRSRAGDYAEACRKKRINFDVEAFLSLDEKRREQLKVTEELRARQNQLGKDMPKLSGEEKEKLKDELKLISAEYKKAEQELETMTGEWSRLQLFIPSIPLAEVPEGRDDSENVEIRRVGTPPDFSFKPKDHVEIGERLKLFDIERGVKIAGSRNYYLLGLGARLHHAVLSYAIDFISSRGYTLFDPPHIVATKAMTGTGYFPGGEESAYHLDERDSDYHLIGTSEVPVAAYHLDETLCIDELPKRYAGYSPCYRREAGTYGKDTRGLYRVHQFYKVEQVVICRNDPEESRRFHNELLKNAEDFFQTLELPYRIVAVCSGDMGQGQVFKHDIETWMPSRGAYSETHSCSTLHDFQARRLNLRYKEGDSKPLFCHTLNNTLVASPRVLIPLLENHQEESGSVRIPEVLRPYLGGITHLK
ncbi:MAG TPA: serine--tRNA ligase [Oligoflexia bacterium]|nr:serine--tRNA ligase [Oligoflexia bacterium]HMP49313.1 serine--tRNA ligase [Oligoflexia bacterium]